MKKTLCVFLLFFSLFNSSYATISTINADEKQIMIHIKEMTCQLCVYLVNKELRRIDGVISTKASFKDRLVNVVAKKEVDNQVLVQAIQKLEYTPEIIQKQ